MNLVIRAVMLDEQPLEEPLLGIFDARGGTIGRSQANTLALPDPERRLSRLQAEISSGAGGYTIRNAGTTSAILVNEIALAPGQSGRIAHRDELRLGGYVLRVLLDGEGPGTNGAHVAVDARAALAASAQEPRTDPRFITSRPGGDQATIAQSVDTTAPRHRPAAAANPFADLLGSPSAPMGAAHSASDPFADLLAPAPATSGNRPSASAGGFAGMLGSPATSAEDPFAFIGSMAPAAAPAPAPPPRVSLPDDFDPFADLGTPASALGAGLPAMAPATPSARAASASGFGGSAASAGSAGSADLLGAVGASSGRSAGIDEAFGLGGKSSGAGDPLAAFMAGGTPGGKAEHGAGMADGSASTDPLAMFAAPVARQAAPRPAAAANHTAELQGAYVPPRIVEGAVRAPAAGGSSDAARNARPAPAAPQPNPAVPARPALPDPGSEATLPPVIARPSPQRQPAPGSAAAIAAARPGTPVMPAASVPIAHASGSSAAAAPRQSVPTAPAAALAPAASSLARPAAATVPSAGTSATGAPQGGMLWAAFCEGAGISLALPQGLSPEQMRLLGQLMREAVDGTRRLLAERDSARRDAHAAPSAAPARGHNPLAMAADTSVALEQLLQPALRGFIAGPAAVQAALQDVAQHITATSAGAKSGLAAAMACFEPAQLEANLAKGMLSVNRKTRLWEQYQQNFDAVRGDARERFKAQLSSALAAAPPPPR